MQSRLDTIDARAMNAAALAEEMYDKAIHAIKRHEKRDRQAKGGHPRDLDQQTDGGLEPPPLDEITERVRRKRGLSSEHAGGLSLRLPGGVRPGEPGDGLRKVSVRETS